MNTHQAKYESALERLLADLARRDSDRNADIGRLGSAMDKLRADLAKQDKVNTQWMVGLWVAAIVVLGVLIRFSL